MYEDICKNLSTSLLTAFSPLIESQAELASKALYSMTESTRKLLYELASGYNQSIAIDFKQLTETICAIASAIESSSVQLPNLNFLSEINLQKDCVELTEDDCDSISTILDSSDTPHSLTKISKEKIAVPDFIKSILIPIFIALLQMLQTSYYNKMNAIESQKAYMETHQLQDEEIKLLYEQISLQKQEIQIITDHAVSLEDKLNELVDCINAQEPQPEIPDFDSDFPRSLESSAEVPTHPQVEESSDMSIDQSQDEFAE